MIKNTDKQQDRQSEVAIIGIGLRLPGRSNTPKELWDNLIDGFDGVVETSERWSNSLHSMGEISSLKAGLIEMGEWMSFDPLFFGINPTEAKHIDPQQKLLLKCTWEAFEDAMIDPMEIRGTNTTVFIGASSTDYLLSNIGQKEDINVFNSSISSLANKISFCYDFRGASLPIDTACSSSLNAVNLGYQSIVNGNSDYSVVGGVNFILDPNISRSFTSIGIIGKQGKCLPFDKDADGFVRAEGSVVFILKRLSKAIQDCDQIYTIIRGGSSNVDGTLNKPNYFSPSKDSQSNNVLNAFDSTNGSLHPSDIDFYELHGTGTQVGDPTETEAISNVFKSYKSSDNPLLIGSIKCNIGHLEAASGVASLAKCCLMFKHRQFVKNINFNTPNPNIKFDEWNIKVCTETIPFPNKSVSIAINSFGITGSNVCLLLSENIKQVPQTPPKTISKTMLIPISANSKKSLDLGRVKLVNDIEECIDSGITFNDFTRYQISSKSIKLSQRAVIFANNWDEVIECGKSVNIGNSKYNISTSNNKSGNIISKDKNPSLIFVFPGQGPQYIKMGLQLYNDEPIFKQSVDKIDSLLSNHFGYSIIDKLRSIKDDDTITINEPLVAQPTLFIVQVSLFELYKHWGVNPSIILGHSMGEITSVYCSGMIDLETACYIIYQRGILQNKTIGSGKMLVVGLSESDYLEKYSTTYPNTEISCFNSPSSIVITGNENELNSILNSLKTSNIFSAMLGTPCSFHSSCQDVLKDEITNVFKGIKSTNPMITTFSTVTSNQFDNSTIFNSDYIFNNIRNPVLFQQTIENIYKHIESNQLGKSVIFLELSPNPTLIQYIKEMIPTDINVSIFTSLNKKKDDTIEIQQSISQLYCNGVNVDFKCQLLSSSSNSFKDLSYLLPRYQWDESVYFKQSHSSLIFRKDGVPTNQLGNCNETSPFISYTSYIDVGEEPFHFLKGHQARGKNLFPGCGYLDNILKCFPNQDLTISNLEFKSQLLLVEGVKQIITTNLYSSGKNEYRVVFNYKDKVSGKWIQSSNGRISISKLNSYIKKVDIQALKDKCNITTIQQKELYEGIKSTSQLSLTGSFQSIKEAHYGSNCCFAKVSLDSISSYDIDLFFNVCILDACFQVLTILATFQSQLFFERIENLKFFSENIPKSSFDREKYGFINIYCEYLGDRGDSMYINVLGFLPDGTILFHSPRVIFTSSIPIKNEVSIENPNNQLYTQCLQSKDSILPPVNTYSTLFNSIVPKTDSNIKNAFTTYLFSTLLKKNPHITQAECLNESVMYLSVKYTNFQENDSIGKKNLASTMFEILKSNNHLIEMDKHSEFIQLLSPIEIETIDRISNILATSDESKIIPTTYEPIEIKENQLILEIISNSIKPILSDKIVFRILEIGCSFGEFTLDIFNKINSILLDNPLSEIDIELTFSDDIDSNVTIVKDKLNSVKYPRLSILFKQLNLKEDPLQQNFNPSYYDLVILKTLTGNTNEESIKIMVHSIYQILSPNGQLLILDSCYKAETNDKEIENYQQWLSNNCLDSTMDKKSWQQLLTVDLNFKNFNSTQNEPYLILIHKQSLSSLVSKLSLTSIISQYDQVIIFGEIESEEDDEQIKLALDSTVETLGENGTGIHRIKTIEEFENHVTTNTLTEKSIIISTIGINDLTIDNYKQVTMDYIKINQHLLKNELSTKHVLYSKNVYFESTNMLASSLIGIFRYFLEFNQLNLYAIDFGNEINEDIFSFITVIQEIIDPLKHSQKEYVFREGKVYYHRFKLEKDIKLKLKSNSYVQDTNDLISRVNSNLQFKLESKLSQIPELSVEVKTMATGINFKDNLIYRGMVPNEVMSNTGDYHNPEFGFEMSGIITRVGDKVTKYQVGDHVIGIGYSLTSSHAVLPEDKLFKKPISLSFAEAASIPLVYFTSFSSLYYNGRLNNDNKEYVLIHSATGGIGLSCIEILKATGFNSLLFVTVGSKEKEDYLRNKYGDFITGIYSSRNTDYVHEIKKRLNIDNSVLQDKGVDLVINTLSGDFMDANFNCLGQGGRIVDLSITHLNTKDTTDYFKFKYSISYSTFEPFSFGVLHFRSILKKIIKLIVEGKLKLIPIVEYPISKVKEAIEYIGERKHIGKVIVNHESSNDLVSDTISNLNNQFLKDYQVVKSNYKINGTLGKTVLLTGQSGLSLTIIRWISKFGNQVENIIILSKSSIKYPLELLIGILKSKGYKMNFIFRQCNVGIELELSNTMNEIYKSNNNLSAVESIFHNAFSPSQCEPLEIDMNHLNESFIAKADGAINLDTISYQNKWPIKNFILASSITTELGSQRQCGYVAANCILNGLARLRRSLNLPCTSIIWGVHGQSGFVSRNESVSKLFELQGLVPVPIDMVLGTFDLLLQNNDKQDLTNVLVSSFEHKSFASTLKHTKISCKFDYITNPFIESKSTKDDSDVLIEFEILNKFSELFSTDVSKINQDIKLIDYGADSLLIVSFKNFIDKTYSPNILSIAQLQDATIGKIIETVTSKFSTKKVSLTSGKQPAIKQSLSLVKDDKIDWIQELKLDLSIKPTDEMIELYKESIKNVNSNDKLNIFLTGSTGYLGIYLLYNLISTTSNCKSIYCLSRSNSIAEGLNKIFQLFKEYQLYDQITNKQLLKIQIVLGDYSLDKFGFSLNEYTTLSNEIDIVINCAADTNSQLPYSNLKNSTIKGIDQCIKLSCTGKLKKLVQISSMGIYSNNMDADDVPTSEELDEYKFGDTSDPSFIEKQNNIYTGYIQSKIVSEYHVKEAALRGIPSMIIRPPFLFSDTDTGITKSNDFLQSLIQSCYSMGVYPVNENQVSYVIPVSWAAKNISFLSIPNNYTTSNQWNQSTPIENLICLNLFGESFKLATRLSSFSNQLEIPLKPIKVSQFFKKLLTHGSPSTEVLMSFIKNDKFLNLVFSQGYFKMSKNLFIGGNYKASEKLKSILQSNNSYQGWQISNESIKNHLEFIFKKKINFKK